MKENIKLILLGTIALATVGIFFQLLDRKSGEESMEGGSSAVATNVNNGQANGTQNLNPVFNSTNNPNPEPIQANLNTPPQKLENPPAPQGPPTKISFAKMEHNFGDIKQESTNNQYQFVFTNTGDKPLLISNAQGSCGCTVPNWPKEPIMPGKTGRIDVDYKPGNKEGKQEQTVTVTANTNPQQTVLKIKANVSK